MPLETVIIKGKKLEIIFDLDHTLIFSFINTYDKEAAKSFLEKYPEKNVNMLSFSYQKKCIIFFPNAIPYPETVMIKFINTLLTNKTMFTSIMSSY